MAAAKPEVLVTQKPTEISVKFQRLEPGFRGCPTHLSYCQPYSMLADVGYRTGSWNFEVISFHWKAMTTSGLATAISISGVGQHPSMSTVTYLIWATSKHGYSRWNFADSPLQTRVTTINGKIPNVLPTSGRHIGSQGEVGVKILHHFVAQPYLGKVTKAFG